MSEKHGQGDERNGALGKVVDRRKFLRQENGQPTELKVAGLNVDDVRFKRKK